MKLMKERVLVVLKGLIRAWAYGHVSTGGLP